MSISMLRIRWSLLLLSGMRLCLMHIFYSKMLIDRDIDCFIFYHEVIEIYVCTSAVVNRAYAYLVGAGVHVGRWSTTYLVGSRVSIDGHSKCAHAALSPQLVNLGRSWTVGHSMCKSYRAGCSQVSDICPTSARRTFMSAQVYCK